MIRAVPEQLGASTEDFAAALKAEGLPAAAHYIGKPVYKYPLFIDHTPWARGEHAFNRIDYSATRCPGAQKILDTCIIISVNEGYTDQDLEETVHGIERCVH